MADYKLTESGCLRTADRLHIPASADNRDWKEFQAWLTLGNTADAKDPLPPLTAEQVDAIAVRADAEVQALAAMTPTQARAFVAANINTLVDAKALLGRMVVVLSVLAKRL